MKEKYVIQVKYRNDSKWNVNSTTVSLENANKLVEELIKEEEEAKKRGYYVMPAGPFFSASMEYDESHSSERIRIVQEKTVRTTIDERQIALT